jgi:membrane-associated phospholipid phosphatase
VGIELIRFACPLIGSALVERVLQVLNLLAHGFAAAGVGLALTAAGLATRNRRFVRVGLAVLLAAVLAGLAANGLKLAFRVPRPHTPGSYSFPSGHATTAFAVAAVLARAFPPAGPLFAFVALFGGLARVYFRDHFLIDVIGGGLLGTAIGLAVMARFPGIDAATGRGTRWRSWSWGLVAVAAVLAVSWFAVYEHELDAYLRKTNVAEDPPQLNVAIQFGTPGARSLLRRGWSGDEKWNGKIPFVWAEGTDSLLSVPPLLPGDYRARLRVLPLVLGEGLSCQVIDLGFNGKRVGRVLLDRGWNDYDVSIPKALVRPAGTDNEMGFRFAYAAVPGARDSRRLAVAFKEVEIAAETASPPRPAG